MSLKITTTYEGPDTAEGLRHALVEELRRRLEALEAAPPSTAGGKISHQSRLAQARATKAFIEELVITPKQPAMSDAVIAELCEEEVKKHPGRDWSVTAITVARDFGLRMNAVADAWARVRDAQCSGDPANCSAVEAECKCAYEAGQ